MTLAEPFWLILIIPLAMGLWLWRPLAHILLDLRCLALVLLVLAICGLSVRLPVRSGTVVLVADRSLSMPADSPAIEKESAELVHAAMRSGQRLGVVSFAESAAVEQAPQAGKFAGFTAEVGHEASNLADALELAVSLIDKDEPGRVLVLSDGYWTGRDVELATARAAAAGIAIDYRALQRPAAGDLAVQQIQGPQSVLPGESFLVTAWIQSPKAQTVSYQLDCGQRRIAEGTLPVPSGSSPLLFRDTAAEPGAREYVLKVQSAGDDPVPGNNRARLLVGVRGSFPLLCVNSANNSALPALLAKGRLHVDARTPDQCGWTLEELASYSGVLLENTPAATLSHVGMQNLSAWVTQTGGGLMITGGRQSFGAGGYFKSPLDKLLPVSMELRQEHRKFSLAIVVALDRSGSMAMRVPDGRMKIELADLATAEVVNMLGPLDQFGCFAVDSIAHEIVPLTDVVDKPSMCAKIQRIDSAGGGIFVYEALTAAASMIAPAKAGTKHIILFADAADSEQPGDYKTLVDGCLKAGITISVIGLGTEHDVDAELLKDIARRGGGQCMFTSVSQELPRLFAQDTFVISRSSFIEDATAIRPTAGLTSITRQPLGTFPDVGGYNLCYLRPDATLAVVSQDEYKAPVLASWQAGLGRVLCYTGEVDGQFTGPMAQWKNVGDFLTSLARWTAGKDEDFGQGMMTTQELQSGVCRVELHLDPARESSPFSRLPELTVLSARPGEVAASRTMPMTWSSADVLLAEIPLSGSETLLSTVAVAGKGQTTLAPLCLPYSPEYRPQKPDEGAAALERLAMATGGCERISLGDVWHDIPRRVRYVSLTPYLLLTAVAVFLMEVLQRRTGLLSVGRGPARWFGRVAQQAAERTTSMAGKLRRRAPAAPTQVPTEVDQPEPTAVGVAESPGEPGMADAMAAAQWRASRRTDRR